MTNKFFFNVNEKTQFAILGLGKFGLSVALELEKHGRSLLCCDSDEALVQELSVDIEHIVQADATNDEFLKSIGISNFDVVVVAFSKDFEDSILTVMKLKENNVGTIIVKANDERHKKVLKKVGATHVILPESIIGERLGHALTFNDPLTYIYDSDIYNIEQILPKNKWLSKTLSELDLRNKQNINIIGIIRQEQLLSRITPDTSILKDDILIVVKSSL